MTYHNFPETFKYISEFPMGDNFIKVSHEDSPSGVRIKGQVIHAKTGATWLDNSWLKWRKVLQWNCIILSLSPLEIL